jgi:enamine deaminase RidA (YjgF/YER057c/UK114 family)
MPDKEVFHFEGILRHGPHVPHGVRYGGLVFFSAIRPPKPDGTLAETPEEQAEDLFENLRLLMEGLGGSLQDVLSVQVFVGDPAHIRPMNQVWYRLFPMDSNPAARQVIQAGAHGGATREMYSIQVIARDPAAADREA